MHRRDPKLFARILERAADHIAAQDRHPGQTLPGVWALDDNAHEPARLIGVIVTLALAEVCKADDCDLQEVMTGYAAFSHAVPLTPKGAPDQIAINHLRAVAEAMRDKDEASMFGRAGDRASTDRPPSSI